LLFIREEEQLLSSANTDFKVNCVSISAFAYETVRRYMPFTLCDVGIVTLIKLGRLRWAGHIIRMEEDRPAKRILVSNPGGARGRGKLKIR
jgi:hypothetical protein